MYVYEYARLIWNGNVYIDIRIGTNTYIYI